MRDIRRLRRGAAARPISRPLRDRRDPCEPRHLAACAATSRRGDRRFRRGDRARSGAARSLSEQGRGADPAAESGRGAAVVHRGAGAQHQPARRRPLWPGGRQRSARQSPRRLSRLSAGPASSRPIGASRGLELARFRVVERATSARNASRFRSVDPVRALAARAGDSHGLHASRSALRQGRARAAHVGRDARFPPRQASQGLCRQGQRAGRPDRASPTAR